MYEPPLGFFQTKIERYQPFKGKGQSRIRKVDNIGIYMYSTLK